MATIETQMMTSFHVVSVRTWRLWCVGGCREEFWRWAIWRWSHFPGSNSLYRWQGNKMAQWQNWWQNGRNGMTAGFRMLRWQNWHEMTEYQNGRMAEWLKVAEWWDIGMADRMMAQLSIGGRKQIGRMAEWQKRLNENKWRAVGLTNPQPPSYRMLPNQNCGKSCPAAADWVLDFIF